MTPIELNIILFAVTVIVFAAIGFSASRKQHSADDYFHDKSLAKNAVSLIATNITLGTGLVYLVTGAQHNGLLMLLIPVMTWLGYYLLAAYLEKATALSARTGKNFLASIDAQIVEATGKRSPFAATVSGSLVVVFVLVLAFEIFASAKVVAPFVFKTPGVSSEVTLSIIVFCITILYTILGGIGAVFKVDFLQVPLVCLMIPVLLVTAIPNLENPGIIAERFTSSLKMDGPILAGVAIACINAVTTQFYSLLNWGAVSHVELADQQRLLKWVGAGTAVVLTAFVLVGLLHPVEPGGQVWQDVTNAYVNLAATTTLHAYVFCAILVLGMLSVLLTTTDAVVITAIMFWYDNVAKGDSKNQISDPAELQRIRRIGTFTFAFCFAILMTINYLQPDPFYLLMSMAGGAAVFGPMIAVAGWLGSKGESLRVFTPPVVYGFVALFVFAGVASAMMLMWQSPFVGYVGVSAFALSLVYALVLAILAKKIPLHSS
ncbi:MAG TPA: hypothetical protein PLO37_06610 [Candidatus Hydrogenedentes bacterium]|nr:hypothetical protein [Candidatus Hydrogenedentota bacterium]HPG66503.1 hypothetical protein [Candidatus Hydrogenedentota bacterium]